ncbi:MAG TPA: MYXO-CTERM sorting domain-containing protein [Kofleriaceae bacterium]|nr:MYXO-CTERM sorting domain-containing protein [Kofleriaceae bacterium]
MLLPRAVVAAVVLLAPLSARADDRPNRPLRFEKVVIPARPVDVIPNTIYLNRCAGGCTVKFGTTDDARTHTSTIPQGGSMFTVAEFAWGDAEWNALVQCFKEVYSPYAVTITDVQPSPDVHYNEAIVAGVPQDIGLSDGIGGIAPVMGNCNPVDHAISFSFANIYGPTDRVNQICWTAAQEVGHTYGLDHEYEFFDGRSACNDPMTYRDDCGGQKFFRDLAAKCGEFNARECACSHLQTSHKWMQTVLGVGTPITAPTVSITSPTATTISNGETVHALASAQRGVVTVQLLLNGYPWVELPGVAFGLNGQPASDYALKLPDNVPDGVIDIEVVATDDLGIATKSAVVTVTKGAPCTSADSCLEGQLCDAGKCYWETPTGETGDACSYPQFCVSGLCQNVDGSEICTTTCNPTTTTSCPDNFECRETTSAGVGVCAPIDTGGGCCSTSTSGTPWPLFGLSAAVLGFVMRRRRH